MRAWYLAFAALLWLGILLTGFDKASWLLYIPAAGLVFAAASGICPTQIAVFAPFGKPKEADGPRDHGQAHSGS